MVTEPYYCEINVFHCLVECFCTKLAKSKKLFIHYAEDIISFEKEDNENGECEENSEPDEAASANPVVRCIFGYPKQ